MKLGPEVLRDPARAATFEWLLADGRGGWASSTVIGLNTRRSHGLLVAPLGAPERPHVLLSRLEETLVVGERRLELGVSAYPDTLHPRGFDFAQSFSLAPLPALQWEAAGGRLMRSVARLPGEPATVLVYVYEGAAPVSLELRPMLAFREAGALQVENGALRPATRLEVGDVVFDLYDGCPALRLRVPGGEWAGDGYWYRRCEYTRDREAGLAHHEDLWSPGRASVLLRPGRPLGVLVSAAPIPVRADAAALLEAEKQRLRGLRAGADGVLGTLRVAADAFLVRRADGRAALLAGYPQADEHWRDVLVALPGVGFEARRFAEVRALLQRLPEELGVPAEPRHDAGVAADLPLRGVLAVARSLLAGGEVEGLRRRLLPWVFATLASYAAGRIPRGALVEAALVAGPDWRCAVDVQALWFNALLAGAELARGAGDTAAAGAWSELASRVRDGVARRLWSDEYGFLADSWSPASGADWRLRARQIQAVALPHALLPRERAARLLDAVGRALLTPMGVRTLAPTEPGYVGTADPAVSADAGQGGAWPALAVAYFDALVRVSGEQGKRAAQAWLRGFERHFEEAGLGCVSAAFDGDPPHRPRGPIADAAATGELLRLAARVGALRGTR